MRGGNWDWLETKKTIIEIILIGGNKGGTRVFSAIKKLELGIFVPYSYDVPGHKNIIGYICSGISEVFCALFSKFVFRGCFQFSFVCLVILINMGKEDAQHFLSIKTFVKPKC